MKYWLLIISLCCALQPLQAQAVLEPGRTCQLPIKMTPYLAGNFGELRPNHFHAGLDFKTQGTVGHGVYAFDDGYVARAAVNAYGYGLVLYVSHPSGLTTVYAHLNAFADSIASRVLNYQLEHEENNPDITFAPGEIPVRRGQRIATSGNTGSSGGPHVHFEVRDTKTGDYYDPMIFFLDKIKDTTPPRLRNVYVYPLGGMVCGAARRQSAALVTGNDGKPVLNRKLTAWGKIGLGLKAYDHMDGTANIYGVKYVRLYMEDSLIYSFQEHNFVYEEHRFTNSLTDYGEWYTQRSMIMKSFREPGNRLRMIRRAVDDGVIDINEERTYRFRYELQDAHGNLTVFPFSIQGVPVDILPAVSAPKGSLFAYDADNCLDTAGCRLEIPSGRLYKNFDFCFSLSPSADPKLPCVSPVYVLGDFREPLHDYCTLTIDLPAGCSADTSRLYIACLNKGGSQPVGGKYIAPQEGRPAAIQAEIRQMGHYAIREDVSKPTVSMQGKPSARRIVFSVGDKGSGILSWRGTIDGHFVPFVMNAHGQVVADPLQAGVATKRQHRIELTVSDRCGNVAVCKTEAWF